MVREHRPPQPSRHAHGKWKALVLAVVVNLAFVGVLVFSVSWRNPKPEAVTAELYAPAGKSTPPPVAEPPRPVVEPPKPEPPKPEPPKPEPPKPEPPKPEPPKPEPPKPVVAPPKPEPDTRAADIALKAKQAEERKRREQQERDKAEAEKKRRDAEEKKKAEDRRVADEKRKADDKRAAEQRERQQRETDAMRAQAEREAQQRTQAEAEARARSEAQARANAEAAARTRAQAEYVDRIRSKVRGNVIVPPDIAGNPEAVFEVVQLPTGEIIDVQLRKSSGVRAYDDAVQRAILKSSPLPRPDRPDLFQRALRLTFRPNE
jgi:colicin import membrane protein